MHSDLERILLTDTQIRDRVQKMGRQITKDYAGEEIILVGVLKGAVTFFSDLARVIDRPVSFDFISCSSYGANAVSSGDVKIKKDLDKPIEGKNVLVIEDIIDTGVTLSKLLPILKDRGARSVKLATLLSKPSRRIADVHIDYNGFEVPDCFVVGYGLDYAGRYRNLPYIGVLKEEIYSK
jgi:hypoxanthine phosphoribosyltransferase